MEELPHKVGGHRRRMTLANKFTTRNDIMDDVSILELKEIVDDNPNLYLDELTFLFGVKTGKFVHYITVW